MFGKEVKGAAIEPSFDNLPDKEKEAIATGVYKELRMINNSIDKDDDLLINEKAFKESIKKYYDTLINIKKTLNREATIYEEYAHFISIFIEKKPLSFTKKLKYRSNEILSTLFAIQQMNKKNKFYHSLPSEFFNNLVMLFINAVEKKERGCLECIILLLRAIYIERASK